MISHSYTLEATRLNLHHLNRYARLAKLCSAGYLVDDRNFRQQVSRILKLVFIGKNYYIYLYTKTIYGKKISIKNFNFVSLDI